MSVTSITKEVEREDIVDDVSDIVIQAKTTNVDEDVLARLMAKKAKKEEENMPPKIVEEKTRSISMGFIGSGQGGGRIAEAWYNLGYEAVAINTAMQDLKHINIPEQNKLLLDYGLGGAAKDLEIGRAAAEAHKDAISEIVNKRLGSNNVLVFCTSLGGGSGAGSSEVIVDILASLGKPIVVITALPQSSDDALSKHNALVTLSRFGKMAQNKQIDNLIVVDNARIESMYSNVSQLSFFGVANKAIVDPINVFNTLSKSSSPVKGIDSNEFGKLFLDGGGLTTYGKMDVHNYEDLEALAEAIIDNLDGSLLASGFDLKQARYVGVMFVASQKVWDKIPQAAINYAMTMVDSSCGTPLGSFKGIYIQDSEDDFCSVYSMFSGLGLPEDRVQQLKSEAKDRMQQSEAKDNSRNLSLKLDSGEETVSEAERIRQKILNKKSGLGKLHNSVIDKRK